jgi:hypothetical protein
MMALILAGLVFSALWLVIRVVIRKAQHGAQAPQARPRTDDAGTARPATNVDEPVVARLMPDAAAPVDDAAVATPLEQPAEQPAEQDAAAPVDDAAVATVTDAAFAASGDGSVSDAARVRTRRGRRVDGGMSAGISREPDF